MLDPSIHGKDVKVWVPQGKHIWRRAEIVSIDIEKRSIVTLPEVLDEDDGDDRTAEPVSVSFDLVSPCNPDIMENIDDLTCLSYLNEPSVLYALKNRYARGEIYTYCGIILVACNPFAKLDIYNDSLIQQYRGRRPGELEPHLFSIAEEAYSHMRNYKKNQSIVISGESGAGKTVSAKYFMIYFASVSSDANMSNQDYNVEKRVLASNPIMEAFGNAKTVRNNNSSRFGKYISILFNNRQPPSRASIPNLNSTEDPRGSMMSFADSQPYISGAYMRTYLLEKSRVITQASNERGYHIFYHLCAALCMEENRDLQEMLFLQDSRHYPYLNKGNSFIVEGINDVTLFDEVRASFSALGILPSTELAIYKVLAIILHLGNIQIDGDGGSNASISATDESLLHACNLLQVSSDQLSNFFLNKKVSVGREVILSPVKKELAVATRDALSKHLYAIIFDWIVEKINLSLKLDRKEDNFIGILDIYGFEVFKVNSYEQFCINYANEKLQQQFNQHVFKLEQEEYKREELSVAYINFYDNQPCIDLIESKLGVLSLLDEETKMANGSDSNFLIKLYDNNKTSPEILIRPRGNLKDFFTIKHYAATVPYNITKFTEKNRDAISEDLLDMVYNAGDVYIRDLFAGFNPNNHSAEKNLPTTGPSKKATVSMHFKKSLGALMDVIRSTRPHYCRCLKPNQEKKSFLWDSETMLEQLTACGVLDTIRISALGYPTRWEYNEFNLRYSLLVPYKVQAVLDLSSPKNLAKAILDSISLDPCHYNFGKTKVFFKAGHLANIEQLRSQKIHQSIIMIQKTVRSFIHSAHYRKLKACSKQLQAYVRIQNAVHILKHIKEMRSAILLQSVFKMAIQRKAYQFTLASLAVVNSGIKIHLSKIAVLNLKRNRMAACIQSHVRRKMCEVAYRLSRESIITIQRYILITAAKSTITQSRMAEKDVMKLKETSDLLKNENALMGKKIVELQQAINQMEQERLGLQSKMSFQEGQETQFKKMVSEYQAQVETSELTLQQTKYLLTEREQQMAVYQQQIAALEDANKRLESLVTQLQIELDTSKQSLIALGKEKEAWLGERANNDHRQRSELISNASEKAAFSAATGSSGKAKPSTPDEVDMLKAIIHDLKAQIREYKMASVTSTQRSRRVSIMRPDKEVAEDMLDHMKQSVIPGDSLSLVRSTSLSRDLLVSAPGYKHDARGASAGSDSGSGVNESVLMPSASKSGIHRRSSMNVSFRSIMFSFDQEDPHRLIESLILNADINSLYKAQEDFFAPTLFVIFYLCIKFADFHANSHLLTTILTESIEAILRVISMNKMDISTLLFWLSNTTYLHKMLHYEFSHEDNAYELKNFDISDYKLHLGELCNKILGFTLVTAQSELNAIIVPSMLENEPLQGLANDRSILAKFKKAAQSKHSCTDVIEIMEKYFGKMVHYNVDPFYIMQFFETLLDYICSVSLNNLFLRKELCHWSKGLHITYNFSQLEQWLRENHLFEIKSKLNPILQAVKLLQLPKTTAADVESMLALCQDLSVQQIEKILNMYTPESFEERVPPEVFKALRSSLVRTSSSGRPQALFREIKKVCPLEFKPACRPSEEDIQILQTIEIPIELGCDFVEKTIIC